MNDEDAQREPVDGPSDFEKKLARYAKIGVPVATVVGMLIAGKLQGPPLAVLVLASGALIGVITALWASLRALLGETPLTGADAFVIAAPRAEEEQKRAVLRALKDIEFERSVGKISEEDYRELAARYRDEAKRLLRVLDEEAEPRRAAALLLVEKRLREVGLKTAGAASPAAEVSEADSVDGDPSDDHARAEADHREKKGLKKKRKKARAEAKPAGPVSNAAPSDAESSDAEGKGDEDDAKNEDDDQAGHACAACGTMNDDDAVFCKKCGAKQGSA